MFRTFVLTLAASAAFASPAFAGFSYDDFSDTSGLAVNRDARVRTSGGRDVARLTSATQFENGSVFAQDKISLRSSFSTRFTFNINNDAPNSFGSGDGLAFVVQNFGSDFLQVGGLGYQGANVFAVEFDTYNNGSLDGHSSNHTAIHAGGTATGPAVIDTDVGFSLNGGRDVTAWIDYDFGTGNFEVRYSVDGVRPGDADLSYNIDLSKLLGSDDAFIGFTSSTGGGYSNHDIVRWSFNEISAVPEPATWAMMICGMGAVGSSLRRRKTARVAFA